MAISAGDAESRNNAQLWEAMARAMCHLAGSDPDFRMWDGQPLWKWRMHGAEAKARIQAAIDALAARPPARAANDPQSGTTASARLTNRDR